MATSSTASTNQTRLRLDPKFDPDSKETKAVVQDMINKSPHKSPHNLRDGEALDMFHIRAIHAVFSELRNNSALSHPNDHRVILQCLFRHFASWKFLNAPIYTCGDCILTWIAFYAPWLVIPFLELEPPEEYEKPNPNALGERNLPAVIWTFSYKTTANYLSSTIAFDYLVQRTSDVTLRLCFSNAHARNPDPLLHMLLRKWEHASNAGTDVATRISYICNFAESVKLLLARAEDDDGGGVDLRVTNVAGQTASTLMSSLNFSAEAKANVTWQQTRDLLDFATKRALEYGDKLLPALNAALENSLDVKPLCALIASYSPASASIKLL